ncbi:hypothetical protein MKleb_5841 (plasmid) [Klebsiella sp. PL-2018]|nr:hypothetical protein MKleb_5841 [Klebsiella sp. PL-2018]
MAVSVMGQTGVKSEEMVLHPAAALMVQVEVTVAGAVNQIVHCIGL